MTDISTDFNIGRILPQNSIKARDVEENIPAQNAAQNTETNLNNQPSAAIGRSLVSFSGNLPSSKYDSMSRKELDVELEKFAQEAKETNPFDSFYFDNLSSLEDDNQLRAALEFLDAGMSPMYVVSSVQFKNNEDITQARTRVFELSNMGIPGQSIYSDFLEADKNKYQDAKTFLEKFSFGSAIPVRNLMRLKDEDYAVVRKAIIDNGADISSAMLLSASFDGQTSANDKAEKFQNLMEKGFSPNAACGLAHLFDKNNPEIFNNALRYIDMGFDISDSKKLAQCKPEIIEMLKQNREAFDKFNVADAVYAVENSSEQGDEALDLIFQFKKLGCDIRQAVEFSKEKEGKMLPKQRLETLRGLVEQKDRNYSKKAAIEFAKLEDGKTELAKHYFDICKDADLAVQIAKAEFSPKEKEYLDRLIDGGYFYGAVQAAKSPDAEKILAVYDERNQKLKELFDFETEYSYEDLSPRDKYYLTNYGFNSEFYEPKEYLHKFLELKNMTAKNGCHIFNTEHFQKKNDEDFSEMQASMGDGALYNNIVKVLWMNPDSDDYKYFSEFLNLIQDGAVSPSAIRMLESGIVKLSGGATKKLGGWALSNKVKQDLDLYLNVKNTSASDAEFQTNLKDAFVKTYKNKEEAAAEAKTGDAFLIKGDKYISMKTDDKNLKQMNITKETYLKLFPPVSRFASAQQVFGDCYCIETLMSMFQDDSLRSKMIETMREDENGNISIKLPDSKEEIFFDGGNLPENQDSRKFASGAKGFKLFEYAYSMLKQEEVIEKARKMLSGEDLKRFDDFLAQNKTSKDGIFIYFNNDMPNYTTFSEAVEKGLYTEKGKFSDSHFDSFNQYLFANGSSSADVLKAFGMDSEIYERSIESETKPASYRQSKRNFELINSGLPFSEIHSLEKLLDDIKKKDFFKENTVQIAFENHARSITEETDSNGSTKYYIYNPHNQGLPVEFENLEALSEFLSANLKSAIISKKV